MIFRLPQIIGKNGNKNNIINFFKNKLINQELIEVQKNSKRSIIDIEDVVQVVNKFINEKNKILNFSGFEILYASEILKFLITILNIENPKILLQLMIFKYILEWFVLLDIVLNIILFFTLSYVTSISPFNNIER